MNNEWKNFLQRIRDNESLDNDRKEKLIHYLSNNLFSHVRVFTSDEFEDIENILKDYNYDIAKFACLLENTYKIRNVFGKKNGVRTIPKMDYLKAIKKIFSELDMDVYHYSNDFEMANAALARCAYNILFEGGLLNKEASFIDVTKEIYNRYYSDKDVNRSVCKIIKQLNKIEKGFKELDEKYIGAVTSEEFYSLFELDNVLNDLYLGDIIKEFYPVFKNDLFVYIKKAVESYNEKEIKTEDVIKYLRNLKDKKEIFNGHKNVILSNISKIDLDLQKNTESVFVELLDSIKENGNINEAVKQSLLNNINGVFEKYRKDQRVYTDETLEVFFRNCSSYINNFILDGDEKLNGIDSLIASLLDDCKDFLVNYDSKKFKEIINFAVNNTELSIDDLKGVAGKCSIFFKEADIDKIKSIKNSLKDFRNYVNKSFKSKDLIENNLFETILVNNPEFMLKNNRIDELMRFFKGEVSLNDYGYVGSDFRLSKNFLGYEFYKRIVDDNYNLLFEGNLGMMANNFNVLDELCQSCNINLRELSINEDMIYTLLNNDLYKKGSKGLLNLKEFFNEEELKVLLENNPDLLMIRNSDIEIILKRCLLNETDDYNFYDLLVSDLYDYRNKEYMNSMEEELMNKAFRYVDLGVDTTRKIDALEIITSNLISNESPDKLWKEYKKRRSGKQKIRKMLHELTQKEMDIKTFNDAAKKIISLYTSLYEKVGDVNLKNDIISVISDKKDDYEYRMSDNKEEVEAKSELLEMYSGEKKQGELAKEEVAKVISKVDSDLVKDDLKKFIAQLEQKRISENEKKEIELLRIIKSVSSEIRALDKAVEYLDYMLLTINSAQDSLSIEETIAKKSFKISDLSKRKTGSKDDRTLVNELLDGENLIIFADSVNLSEIPNDRNFIDKVNKFLGDNEFSIKSVQFMKTNSFNKDFVEKLSDHRACIWSRRESRTPVRVYFIPIHTKYFTAYYVVHVNFKDHAHLDGGCSTDAVYNRRVMEASNYEAMINGLSDEELTRFIRETKEAYEIAMKPIVSKVESYNKKRNNKK